MHALIASFSAIEYNIAHKVDIFTGSRDLL